MKAVVGVLRGGPSSEYDISLQSGATVLNELNKELYEPLDLFISRNGEWHRHGREVSPAKALRGVDVVINVIHGQYGEDGTVQKILNTAGVPYTGCDVYPSVLAFNKHLTRQVVEPLGIKMARASVIDRGSVSDLQEKALELFRAFPMPAIVKPVAAGSSVGATLARDFHGLMGGMEKAFEVSPKILIEEFIKGKEATVGVIDEFRGAKLYALPPVEIIPPEDAPFFDYEAKYSGKSQEICPGNFSRAEKDVLMSAAKKVHEALELSHYSRSDFIVSPRGVYFLEVNSAAAIGMTSESIWPKSLRSVGSKLSEFLDHIINLARNR